MEITQRWVERTKASIRSSPARPDFLYHRRKFMNAVVLGMADLAAFSMATTGAMALFGAGGSSVGLPGWMLYVLAVWSAGAAYMRLLPDWGLGPVESLRREVLLLSMVFGSTFLAALLNSENAGELAAPIGAAFLISIVLVPASRALLKQVLIFFGVWGLPTVVYGSGWTGSHILQLLKREAVLGYQPKGVFTDQYEAGEEVEGIPVKGGIRQVDSNAPVAILVLSGIGQEKALELVDGPLSFYRTVIIVPNVLNIPSLWVNPRDLHGMVGLEIQCYPNSPPSRFLKRAFDIVAVVTTMPFWLPPCLLLALLIWLEDRGNPVFLQERIGMDQRKFHTWKFRTMATDADAILQRSLEADETLRLEWNANYKLKNDPRVTRIGRLLRRFSLDELPQLLNVLRGDMSLVGPRPIPAYHHEALPVRVQETRTMVKPGISGLWQVSGRSEAGIEGMVLWDPYYVRNWSLWLDAIILVRTVRTVIYGTGAY